MHWHFGFGVPALSILLGWHSSSTPVLTASPQKCEEYARTAVAQQEENLRLGCGLSGPMWNADYQYHYGWCIQGANAQNADWGTNQRAAALEPCRSKTQSPVPFQQMQRIPVTELMRAMPPMPDRQGVLPIPLPGTRQELIARAISNPKAVEALRAVPGLGNMPLQGLGLQTLTGNRLPMLPVVIPVMRPGDAQMLARDWESGVRYTPTDRGRTLFVGDIYLTFNMTLDELVERDELYVGGAVRVAKEINPAPPTGHYMITFHFQEAPLDAAPEPRMSTCEFRLSVGDTRRLLTAQWGMELPMTHLIDARGFVDGLVAVVSIDKPLPTLFLELVVSRRSDPTIYWYALFRGLTIMRL